jgi:hypothetical protein
MRRVSMDINKVNATLGKALTHVHEGQVRDLLSLVAEDTEAGGGNFIEEYVGGLVDQVVESAGVSHEDAAKAVVETMLDLSQRSPIKVRSESDLDGWATKVKLAEAIAKRVG